MSAAILAVIGVSMGRHAVVATKPATQLVLLAIAGTRARGPYWSSSTTPRSALGPAA